MIVTSFFDYQWYRKDFNYIISYCPQTFPGRFYYMYFTHVEIRDHKLNVRCEPLNFDLPDFLNMFVSSVLQCCYIWISRNFTLQTITYGQNNKKKKLKNVMVLIWDINKTTETLLNAVMSAKQQLSFLASSVTCSNSSTLQFQKRMI